MTKNEEIFLAFVKKHYIFLSIIVIVLIGYSIRLRALLSTDFILNDGGLFFVMVRDLQENNFILPKYTSYNFSSIPYAYPPLSFYEIGFLNHFFGFDLIQIFRLYPLVFNLFSIPAFFYLCRQLIRDNTFVALIATFLYSILPSSFRWLVMGGGVTRSPAQTFFLLSLAIFMNYRHTSRKSFLCLSSLCSALVFYHHLEYGLLLVVSLATLSYDNRNIRKWLIDNLTINAITGLAILPYIIIIITNHGFYPFLAAFGTGGFNFPSAIGQIILGLFTEEILIHYINVLAIIGIFLTTNLSSYRRISIWLFLIMLIDYRSPYRSLVFPVAILAGFSIIHIYKSLQSHALEIGKENDRVRSPSKIGLVFIGFSLLYPFYLSHLSVSIDKQFLVGISRYDREAMNWIKKNTEKLSEFVVIDQSPYWSTDRVGEWLPALAERKVVSTAQGAEWLPERAHYQIAKKSDDLRKCVKSFETCPIFWENEKNDAPKFVYIRSEECELHHISCKERLTSLIQYSQSLNQVYSNYEVEIFSLIIP